MVQNGSDERTCPQAYPAWFLISDDFVTDLLTGNLSSFNFTEEVAELPARIASLPPSPPDPTINEDCLFLDVTVPKAIFDGGNNMRKRGGAGAPVLVWYVLPAASMSFRSPLPGFRGCSCKGGLKES